MRTQCVFFAASVLAITACGGDDASDAPDAEVARNCAGEMFDTYGEPAFLAVNDSIIDLAVAAPTSMLGTSFQDLAAEGGARVEAFRTNLANFLVLAYGGPNNYTGPSMADAHANLGITQAQYDYFITEVVVPALADNGVPEADITECFAPPVTDPDFVGDIVTE